MCLLNSPTTFRPPCQVQIPMMHSMATRIGTKKVDDVLVGFILSEAPTTSIFIDKLVEVYTPLVDRFPTVLDILKGY